MESDNPAGPFNTTNIFLDANVESIPGLTVNNTGIFSPTGQATIEFDPNISTCITVELSVEVGSNFVADEQITIGMAAFSDAEYCIGVESGTIGSVLTYDELQCCMDNTQFAMHPASPSGIAIFDGRPAYVVTNNAAWTADDNDFVNFFGATPGEDLLLDVDLVLAPGVTLTLNNINLRFAHERRILVRRNAHLIINESGMGTATRISGLCNAMWQGIQVLGPGMNNSRTRLPSNELNFGTVYVTGDVQISDALFGIAGMSLPQIDIYNIAANLTTLTLFPGSTFFPTISSHALYAAINSTVAQESGGGMMFVSNGPTFYNCLEALNMSYHTAPCNFSPPLAGFPAYIECQNVVREAVFTSDQLPYPFNTASSPVTKGEAGIHTIRYLPHANNPLNFSGNRFNNLRYAIRSVLLDNTRYHVNDVQNCDVGISIANFNFGAAIFDNIILRSNRFNNCNISIQAARTRLQIFQNTINDSFVPDNMVSANPIGIFLMGSDFDVTENQINYTRSGIALLSNDFAGNRVFDNNINTCAIGVWNLGNNSGTQITCNTISNYGFAICAQNYTAPPAELGLLDDQGNCYLANNPADNFFQSPFTYGSFTGYELFSIMPPANNFDYFYRNETGFIPQLFAGEVSPIPCIPIGPMPLPTVEQNCGAGHQPKPDEEILALTDERLLNQEAMRKVRYYLYDAEDTLAAQNLLKAMHTDMSKRLLIPYYIIGADLGKADSLLATLPDQRTEELHFRWLHNIYSNLRHSGRDITAINSGEEDTIRIIADAYTQASFEARSILHLLFGEEHPVSLPDMPSLLNAMLMQNMSVNFKNGQANPLNGNKVSKLYPNPTKDNLTFESSLPDEQTVQLTLFNTMGRKMLTQYFRGAGKWDVPTNTLSPGLYYYTLTSNGELLQTDKLIIIP